MIRPFALAGRVQRICSGSWPRRCFVSRSALGWTQSGQRSPVNCFSPPLLSSPPLKLSVDGRKVSLLNYKDFDEAVHPELHHSVRVHLPSASYAIRDYSSSENPPILHRIGPATPGPRRSRKCRTSGCHPGLCEQPRVPNTVLLGTLPSRSVTRENPTRPGCGS